MANYNALLLVTAVLLAASVVIVGELSKPIVNGSLVKIAQINGNPQKFVNQTVSLEGTLRVSGSYWENGVFYLDDNGSGLEVFPWAPLEVYRPQDCANCTAPATMMQYIDKKLLVSGLLREMPNDYYNAAAGLWVSNGTKYVFSVSDARIIG